MLNKNKEFIKVIITIAAIVFIFLMRNVWNIGILVSVFAFVLNITLLISVRRYLDDLKEDKDDKDELVSDLLRITSFYWVASFLIIEFNILLMLAFLMAIGILIYLTLQLLTTFKTEKSLSFSKTIYTAISMLGINLIFYMLVLPELFAKMIK
ncbi:hypothetical protein [Microaceticoccus formicicus]|uniref:hypothetical protein n=1 Tax=Microaceticoccus formicicus TaxID=3118105 RepID=UPI003CD038D6|nr:hypothetical protein VZL98_02180 [Peptoniphilaceae bacterium AMB_02]